jgi:thiosulfate/3-mercaptopyruvate sulfurtransferase
MMTNEVRRPIIVLTALILALIATATWGSPGSASYSNGHLLMQSGELVRLIDSSNERVAILDFGRSRMDYLMGHIPGAVHIDRGEVLVTRDGIPGMLPPISALAEVLQKAGVSNDSRVVIYDDGDALWASRLFWSLEYLGHSNVAILDGGLSRWKEAGRPIATGGSDPQPGSFVPDVQTQLLADRRWLSDHLGDPQVRIVDSRSPAEYEGTDRRAARGGHIPGAVNINWTESLDSDSEHTLLPPEELEELFSAGDVTPGREIVTHCQTGIRAAHSYFTLRLLGYRKVRVYDASWVEWGNAGDTPIVEPPNVPEAPR